MKKNNELKTVIIMLLLVFIGFCSTPSFLIADQVAPDPASTSTGGGADVIGATAGAPTAEDMKNLAASEPLAVKLADVVGHNRIAINMVWVLFCGFLVMFMQAGFALAETGFTQAKNAGHTMALTGCFILAFGWFGFNAGSSLAGGDLRIAVVTVNTMLASHPLHQRVLCGAGYEGC